MKKSAHKGSSFDSWVDEQGDDFKAQVIAGAIKRQFVSEVRIRLKELGIGINKLQRMLKTGPSQVQRLLDPDDTGISLKTIAKAMALLELSGHLTVNK